MMFLQYATWGAWAPVLWPHLTNDVGISQAGAGWVFGTLWLACMVSPLLLGQLADRSARTEMLLAGLHGAGAVVLWVLQGLSARGPGALAPWLVLMSVYSLLYAPTLALTSSIVFRHVPDDEYGKVRVWGTIGWIASGLVLTALRSTGALAGVRCDAMFVAAVASTLLALLCPLLPRTPAQAGSDPLAFRRAFVLLRDPKVAWFFVVAFAVTTELQFYYGPTAGFLETAIHVSHARVPAVMTIGQAAEVVTMAFTLHAVIRRWSIRTALVIGVLAWPARYAIFALAPIGPLAVMRPLVIASLALHGLGYTFFFATSQIFVDRVAPPDIRASAQSLLALATLGLGNFLGTLFTARMMTVFTSPAGETAWPIVFSIPCALTALCAIVLVAFVRLPTSTPAQ